MNKSVLPNRHSSASVGFPHPVRGPLLWSLLGFASCAGLQAVEIGLNFARDGGGLTTGTADGCSAWTNVRDTDGFPGTKVLTGTKITTQWHASNSWYAGAGSNAEQRIYACYLDDGQSSATPTFGNPANDGIGVRVKLSGMSRWLALNEHLTYKIRAYCSTDTDGATFQPVTIRDGGGTELATFTRAVLGDNDYPTGTPPDSNVDPRGYGDSPDTLDANTITLTIPRRAGSVRGCLAALKIVGVGTGPPVDHFESGDGTVNVANAHLGAGLTSVFLAGQDHPTVTGTFDAAATHHIDVIPPAGGFVVQSYDLLTLPPGETLDLADLSLGTLPRGVVGGLELDTSGTNRVLKLTITDLTIPSRLYWTGAVAGGAWDVDTTQSWSYDGAASGYLQGDEVVFDDTATGTTSVALNAAVLPFSVVVENDENHPYSIGGPGSIDGSGDVTKRGIGTLTLGTANGYAGLTTVESGVVTLGANAALGATSGVTAVWTDARIDLNGCNIGSETLNLSGSGPEGDGALVNSSTTPAAANSIVLAGDVTIGGSGDIALGSVTGSGASLTKAGTGLVSTSSAFGFTGTFTVDEGTWEILAGATLASCLETHINDGGTLRTVGDNKTFGFVGAPEDKITLHEGGTLTTASSSTHMGTLVFDGGTLSAETLRADWGNYNLDQTVSTSGAGKTSLITGGNITLSQAGGTIFDIAAGDTLVIASKIDGDTGATDQGLIKNGTGTLVLSAANTHDSPTAIDAGLLVLNGSLRNTSAVTVASGATLGGTGTANGSVTVQTGAIIAPGETAPIGTLTLGNSTMAGTFQCQLGETTCDQLAVLGALDLTGGTIELTTLAAPTAPVLVLASAASITGTPAISGTVPAGYTLQTTATQVRLVSGSAGFSGWIGAFGLAEGDQDLDDDSDADGLDNAIEYVLGGNPANGSDVAKLPQGVRSGDNFVFSFDRVVSSETPDVSLSFQHGDSLDSWDSIPVDVANPPQVTITRSGDNLTDRIVVTIPATGSLLFGRLSVTTTAP